LNNSEGKKVRKVIFTGACALALAALAACGGASNSNATNANAARMMPARMRVMAVPTAT
jgi:hypothetical protein